jgi:undecaprenyl-diphosphatase
MTVVQGAPTPLSRYRAPPPMSAFQAIVLGVVQGLTEFLPISSSAHLRIVPAFAGWEDPGAAFTAVVQLGTMAAVLLYFRADLWRIASTWLRGLRDTSLRSNHDYRMGWYIILGTVPIAIVGFALRHQIKTGARDLYVIGTALILFSFVMLAAERVATQKRDVEEIDRDDAVTIGLAQALALVPGVSRSGATISAGLFRGLTRTAAARYSFLLSIPAVVLSGLFELKDVGEGNGAAAAPTAIATLLAFVVGYASIAWLLRFLVRHPISVFAFYRIAIGALVLVLTASGAIS